MKKSVTATVRFDKELWRRVEQQPGEERRPIAQFIYNIVAEHIGARGKHTDAQPAAGSAEAA